jgi:hypothetical protein
VPVLDATRGTLRFLNSSALSTLDPVIQNLGQKEFIGQAQAAGMFNGATVMDAEGVCESVFSIGGMVVGSAAGAVYGGMQGAKLGPPGEVAGAISGGIGGALGGATLGDKMGGAICGWAIGETGTKVEHGQQGGSDTNDDFSSFGSDDIGSEMGDDSGDGSAVGTGSDASVDTDAGDDTNSTDTGAETGSAGDGSSSDSDGGDDDDDGMPNPDDPDGFPNPEDPRGLQISGQSLAQGDLKSFLKFDGGSIQFTDAPQLATNGLSVAVPGFLAGSPILQEVTTGKAAIVRLTVTRLTTSILKRPVAKGKIPIAPQH